MKSLECYSEKYILYFSQFHPFYTNGYLQGDQSQAFNEHLCYNYLAITNGAVRLLMRSVEP